MAETGMEWYLAKCGLPCLFCCIQTSGKNEVPKNSPVDTPHLNICQPSVHEFVFVCVSASECAQTSQF